MHVGHVGNLYGPRPQRVMPDTQFEHCWLQSQKEYVQYFWCKDQDDVKIDEHDADMSTSIEGLTTDSESDQDSQGLRFPDLVVQKALSDGA